MIQMMNKKHSFTSLSDLFSGYRWLFAQIRLWISKKCSSGIKKWIFCLACALLFFTSDYLLVDIQLYITIFFVLLLSLLYFLYAFPFRSFPSKRDSKKTLKGFFRGFLDVPFLFSLLFLASVMASFVVNRGYGHFFAYLGLAMYIMAGYLFFSCFSFDEFVSLFTKIFFILCFFSLLCYIPVRISDLIPASYADYSGQIGRYSLLFIDGFLEYNNTKNQGIFWEPGINASFIIVSLLLELVFKKSGPNKIAVVVEFLALLTTGSLAGYVLILPVIFVALVARHKNKVLMGFTWAFFVSFVLCVIFYSKIAAWVSLIIPAFANKGISLSTRLYCFGIDIKIWATSPVFGLGPQRYYELFPILIATEYSGVLDASVSTTGFYIASLGIIGWLLFLVFVLSLLCLKNQPVVIRFGLLVIGFLILNKEPHITDTITWTLFFYLIDRALTLSFPRTFKKYSAFGKFSLLNKTRTTTNLQDEVTEYETIKI
jgi:hypothetical protein